MLLAVDQRRHRHRRRLRRLRRRSLPVYAGEIQCRALGVDVDAFDDAGRPVVDEVGELVIATADAVDAAVLLERPAAAGATATAISRCAPACWRQGDWLRFTPRGTTVIYGRSDATINRFGIRMGTAEIYRVVEELPEVRDSLVVDLEYLGRPSFMPLFVVLRPGFELDAALKARIAQAIRTAVSARFVPDDVFAVAEVPRTLTGKKMELPVRKLLLGRPLDKVANRDAMANPASLDFFVAFAAERAASA